MPQNLDSYFTFNKDNELYTIPPLVSALMNGFMDINAYIHQDIIPQLQVIGPTLTKTDGLSRKIDSIAENMLLEKMMHKNISSINLPKYITFDDLKIRIGSEEYGFYGYGTKDGKIDLEATVQPDIEIHMDSVDGSSILPTIEGVSSFFTITMPNPKSIEKDVLLAGVIDHENNEIYLFNKQGVFIYDRKQPIVQYARLELLDTSAIKERSLTDISKASMNGFGRKRGYFLEHSLLTLLLDPLRSNDTGGAMNFIYMMKQRSGYDPDIIVGSEPSSPESIFLLSAAYFSGFYACDFAGNNYKSFSEVGPDKRNQLVIAPSKKLVDSAIDRIHGNIINRIIYSLATTLFPKKIYRAQGAN